jgi:hypothetical protein
MHKSQPGMHVVTNREAIYIKTVNLYSNILTLPVPLPKDPIFARTEV